MIKIYYTDISMLKELSVLEDLCELVEKQQRSKILRCKNKEDQWRSLAAGLLIRMAVEQQGMTYDSIEIATEKNGKPFLRNKSNFQFSISHSGNMIVCAVDDAGDNPIGADVESLSHVERILKDDTKIAGVLKKVATEEEKNWFSHLPKEQRGEGFLRIWTGKESFGKRNGEGISQDLRKEQVINRKDYAFFCLKEDYYLSVSSDSLEQSSYQLIPMDIAKAFLT